MTAIGAYILCFFAKILPILKTVLKSRTSYGEGSLMGTGVYAQSDPKAKGEMVALTNEVLELAGKHSLTKA